MKRPFHIHTPAPLPLSIANKLVFSVVHLLVPAVLSIFLFYQYPPIATALQAEVCLEPSHMGPCKSQIIRHFYN